MDKKYIIALEAVDREIKECSLGALEDDETCICRLYPCWRMIAKEALEKQIQMKIKEVHVDEYFCPACGSENNCNDRIVTDKFCPECGQALDFPEEY